MTRGNGSLRSLLGISNGADEVNKVEGKCLCATKTKRITTLSKCMVIGVTVKFPNDVMVEM